MNLNETIVEDRSEDSNEAIDSDENSNEAIDSGENSNEIIIYFNRGLNELIDKKIRDNNNK